MVSSKLSFFGTQTGVQHSRKSGFRGLRLLSTMLFSRFILSVVLLTGSLYSLAEPAVENVRVWRAPDNTRLVFDLSAPISHSIFELSNPDRLVIDLPAADFVANVNNLDME
ncbi:MAG: AMIN domain-containing protein, partial [Coleofasciculus sp. C2-GNP5-27]